MCGIVGIWRSENKDPIDKQVILDMRDTVVHRGPDDAGVISFESEKIWLAHRRLSIIDLSSAGHQPMSYANNRYWITYNGEIYNFQKLRQQLLQHGYYFESDTDTEVILAAYDRWGTDCLSKFNGMWAFAIWDTVSKTLFGARDRFGVKPFYYYFKNDTLIFASEIRSILASKITECQINEASVAEFMLTGLVDGTHQTFFQNVKRLSPGHFFILHAGNLQIERYWRLPSLSNPTLLTSDKIETFKELFEDSVRLRLISDVPIGTCLSGGLDSSSIFAVASSLSTAQMDVFSSFFSEGDEFDERSFSSLIAEKYNGNQHIVEPDSEKLFQLLPRILWHLEEPSKAMGVFPQWFVMELASKRVTVLLDGQGGDEVLAGYDLYQQDLIRELVRRRSWTTLWKDYHKFNKAFRNKALLQCLLPWITPFAKSIIKKQRIHHEIGLPRRYRHHNRFKGRISCQQTDLLNLRLARDVEYNMLPALLKYEDKLGMAFSIEARVPFLDYRLVDFAFSLSSEAKYAHGWSKFILRLAMNDILPKEIQWRKDKKGFPTPTRLWFRGKLFNQVVELLLNGKATQNGWFDRDGLEKILNAHHSGKQDLTWEIWRFISFEYWLSVYDKLTDRTYAQPLSRPQIRT